MFYDYLQQSDDTNNVWKKPDAKEYILYNPSNMKYKSKTAARSQGEGKGSDRKEETGDFCCGGW